MKRLTRLQLSRVLSEHAAGNLVAHGRRNWGTATHRRAGGCLMQVARNSPDPPGVWRRWMLESAWFDGTYSNGDPFTSADHFLAAMEKVGLA